MSDQANSAQDFYDEVYSKHGYADFADAKAHFAWNEVTGFVAEYGLQDKKCLEVGSGRGLFQDVVADYTGVDLSESVRGNYRKPFHAASAEELPFEANSFDAIWTITVLEHIPNPERALREMRRVLKPGGILYLKPAWNCRSWICEGIPVRPYGDLSLRQKWVKATLPIRDALWARAIKALPRRIWTTLKSQIRPETELRFSRLNADYSTFWMVDSDACCSIDPFDAIRWFQAQGDLVLSHQTWLRSFLSRSEAVVVRIRK